MAINCVSYDHEDGNGRNWRKKKTSRGIAQGRCMCDVAERIEKKSRSTSFGTPVAVDHVSMKYQNTIRRRRHLIQAKSSSQ